jgi:phosphate starvation-inducible PhoH-like protein
LTPPDLESGTFIEFDDNRLLPLLFGEHDGYLKRVEQLLNVTINARGNQILISGESVGVAAAQLALKKLYKRLQRGMVVSAGEVDAAVRLALAPAVGTDQQLWEDKPLPSERNENGRFQIATRRKVIEPRSAGQSKYIEAMSNHRMTFGIGPAGTGKTYIAVAQAVSLLLKGKVDRIILSRPAVEAGERLGFLPGDIREKVDPYLRPLYDALHDMLPAEQVQKRIDTGEIEIAPLAFMRGRTLSDAYVILDEAQNTSPMQMKMFLTRMGENSYMTITGDLTQIDLPSGETSGLVHAIRVLKDIEGISMIYLTEADVVRHPLVSRIITAYGQHEKKKT